jgi:hypothetical protein
MAGPLKNSFGPGVVNTVADMVTSVYPPFDRARYLAIALDGFEKFELTPRANTRSTYL